MRWVILAAAVAATGCASNAEIQGDALRGQIEVRKRQQEIDAAVVRALAKAAAQPAYQQTTHTDGSVTITVGQQVGGALQTYLASASRDTSGGFALPEDPTNTLIRVGGATLGPVLGLLAGGWGYGQVVDSVAGMGVGMVNALGTPSVTYTGNRYNSNDYTGSFNPSDQWINSGRVRSPNDSTSEPTVVTQPEPVVVTQPTPVIVP